ncbi:TPA: MobC family plasmid mobilization relaxosome protein, partial [Klebsiella pneumoniae]|nr:MobC family plasmid mobilization relaxosome protein [Klebsiella pneumoniae]
MPVLTDEEVNTVRESCRQLGAIGRNLNQVARALNIEFRGTVAKLAMRQPFV